MNAVNRKISPAITGFPELRLPDVDMRDIGNGANLVTLNSGNQPIVQLTLVYDGGKLDFNNPAIPMLVSASLRDGCETLSGDEVEYRLDFNGAWLKSEVRDHNSVVTLTSLSSKLDKVLPIVRGILTSPTFPMQRISRNKDKMVASWELQRKKVDYLAESASLCQLAGSGHPITIEATPERISAVDWQMMVESQRLMCATSSMSAYLAGCFNESEHDSVIRFLESLPTGNQPIVRRMKPFESVRSSVEEVVDYKGALQSAVVMAIPAVDRYHNDYCMLRLVAMALGGYFGSRLMTNLREKQGLTYGVSAGLYGYHEGGAVMVSTQCDNRSVRAVIDGTKREIRHLIENPPMGEELERLVQTANSELASILDSPFNVINHVAAQRLAGTPPDYFDRQQTAVGSLSPDAISDCASRYLDVDKMLVAIAGDTTTMVK